MLTIASADAALKDYYLDAINVQLNGEVSPFFNAIAKTSENVYGKNVRLAISKGDMSGVIAGAEDGDLPAPRSNRYFDITVPLKNIYGTIELSDKVIRASSDGSGAFINVLNAEMDGLVKSAKANLARMLYGNENGVVCHLTSKINDTVYRVDSGKRYLLGMKVVLGFDSPGPQEVVITDVDEGQKMITVDRVLPDCSVSAKVPVTLSGVAEGTELLGLASIFEDQTLYGYNKTTEKYFAPQKQTYAPSLLEEDHLIDMINLLEAYYDSNINMILCSHSTKKLIAGLMSTNRRIVNSSEIAAGYSSVFINDVPVYADKYCPNNKIYFLNTDDFVLNQMCDWSWIEDEGGRVLRPVPGKAAYSATLVKYAELICRRPCAQGMITLS